MMKGYKSFQDIFAGEIASTKNGVSIWTEPNIRDLNERAAFGEY